MSKTKLQHVTRAFDWLVINGITSKPTPEENEKALDVLEDMMNEFTSRNICSSFVFEDSPQPDTDSGIDNAYNNATSTNLALRIAAFFGKGVTQELRGQATQSLSNWSARSGKVNQIEPPRRQPRGSGNTFRFSNWTRYYRKEDNAPIDCDTFNLKVDAIDFFSVDFTPYLLEGATIASYTTDVTNGISLISDSEANGIISMEVKGLEAGYNTIKITVTTSTGRVNPEIVNFNITQ